MASSNLLEAWKNKRVKWERIISVCLRAWSSPAFGLRHRLKLNHQLFWVSSLQTANPGGTSQSPRPCKLIPYNISIYIYTLHVYVCIVAMYKCVHTYINIHIAHTQLRPWKWFRTQFSPILTGLRRITVDSFQWRLGWRNVMVKLYQPTLECDTCTACWFGPLRKKIFYFFFP